MQIKKIPRAAAQPEAKPRVCAYVRVSTDSEELENSLDNQIRYFTDLICHNDSWEFAGIYADNGLSGFHESRPEFQRMIADAHDGKIDLIVVKSVSRFARNTETVLKVSRDLKSIDVGILFQLQNINTLSAAGELMLTLLAAFAQAESEDASSNAHMTYRRKFAAGERASGLERTYGFCADANGEVMIYEPEARVVRHIFRLAERGVWPSKIASYLNREGVSTAKGCKWDARGVFRLLSNVAYKGDLKLQKTYLDHRRKRHVNHGEYESWYITDDHPAIITPQQWAAVQDTLQQRSVALRSFQSTHPEGAISNKATYPLSGKLFCPYCGKLLIHKWCTSGKRGPREYWACRTNLKKGASSCKGVWLPAQVANGWDAVTEPTTVLVYKDEYGMQSFCLLAREIYERSNDCPYIREDEVK